MRQPRKKQNTHSFSNHFSLQEAHDASIKPKTKHVVLVAKFFIIVAGVLTSPVLKMLKTVCCLMFTTF